MNKNSVRLVGANLGFRVAAENCSRAELAALRVGEDAELRRGRIFNGKEPGLQNGYGPGFSRAECLRWRRA